MLFLQHKELKNHEQHCSPIIPLLPPCGPLEFLPAVSTQHTTGEGQRSSCDTTVYLPLPENSCFCRIHRLVYMYCIPPGHIEWPFQVLLPYVPDRSGVRTNFSLMSEDGCFTWYIVIHAVVLFACTMHPPMCTVIS